MLVFGTAGIVAAVLFLFPQWYASRDAWKEELALSAEKNARFREAWEAYLRTPWRRLADVDGKFYDVAQSILRSMTASGLNGADYRVRIFQWPEEDTYHFTLQHLSHFTLEREGRTKGTLGDPCGQCRRVLYDPKGKTISPLLSVQ